MNYKGIGFLLIYIFVHFIVYIYIKNKYNNKNKDSIKIEYIVPPITYEDYFIFKDLNKFYNNLFDINKKELNLIKSEIE
jgi:hypothetical protein